MALEQDERSRQGAEARRLTCREAVELVTAYLEGALGATDRATLDAHLDVCGNCTTYFDQIREAVQLLRQERAGELGAETRAQLLEQFRRWRASGVG